MNDYDTALARVRAYAKKIRDGERAADQESLDRAADLAFLYEDRRWVEEEAAAGRAPKTTMFRGRPVDPAAKHRFGTWLYNRGDLGPSQTTRLLKANEWRQTYSASRGISALQLAAPGARIEYSDDAKRVIDDIVDEINQEPVRIHGIA